MRTRGSVPGLVCALAGLAGALAPSAWARPVVRAAEGVINLKAGDIHTARERSALELGVPLRAGIRHILVLDGPITQDHRQALAAAGAVVGEYLPTHAIIADLSGTTRQALLGLGFVRWVGEFKDHWKIQRAIGTKPWTDPDREAMRVDGIAALNAVLFSGADINAAADALADIPAVVITNSESSGGDRAIGLLAPIAAIPRLAQIPQIGWIEEKPEFAPRAYASRWIVQRNVQDKFPLYDAGLKGKNQIMGIIDGWVTPNHCSFADPNVPITLPGIYPDHRKIYAYNAEFVNYNQHGTHIAGIAVGDAGNDGETRGVAYLARMVFNTWPDVTEDSVYGRFALHYSQGANIHSNSWGSISSNEYDFAARAIDNLSWLYPDNLILFAVSNGNYILNPENAKNCLAVTSCGGAGKQDSMCNNNTDPDDMPGMGPTTDGRRKPEIAGPGCNIWSATGQSCSIRAFDGTSTAAPAVGAIGVLMQQYYTEGYYPRGTPDPDFAFQPTGALIKAAIINAGVDLPNQPGYPNDLEGWGRLQADNVLYFPGDSRRTVLRDFRSSDTWALTTGKAFRLPLRIDKSNEPLRVTMVFHDAPAALQASFAPINDLDLIVESPSGIIYAGNLFEDGISKPGTLPDAINNVEQVLIPDPEPGEWFVRIYAREVNVGPNQPFSVVATGAVDEACIADFEGGGYVDTDDFDAFMRAFVDGDMTADVDNNGVVDLDDADAYILAFEKGC